MTRVLLVSIGTGLAMATAVWPAVVLSHHPADARLEAAATGIALLLLASILRKFVIPAAR